MAPKSRDRGRTTHTHTRSNSSSKMGTNNHQFTQKDLMVQAVKHNNDKKKAAHVYEAHPKIARVNSGQIPSKEQLPAPQVQKHKNSNPSHQHHHPQRSSGKGHHANNANKSGFAIEANEGRGDDNDEDWDTESGAVTPNNHDSEDDSTASDEVDGPAKPQQPTTHQQLLQQSEQKNRQPNRQHIISESPTSLTEPDKETGTLARVDTVRALDVQRPRKGAASAPQPELIQNSNPPEFRKVYRQEQQWEEPQERALQNGVATGVTASVNTKNDVRRKAGTNGITSPPLLRSKGTSRPPSTYSTTTTATSKSDLLRPHPLIRGPSFGHLSLNSSLGFPKPSPLAPLAVVPHATALSTSPSSMMNGSGGTTPYAPSSPTSLRTSSGGSPGSGSEHGGFEYANDRRVSLSSQLSGVTIPMYSSIIRESSGSASIAGFRHDRIRTLSTLSSSSSSAALSSLAHLPTGLSTSNSTFLFTSNTFAGTRPPSPQGHPISFFPPVNPHANVESIHPLLPHPYLGNHLAVLAKKTPIRESLKRVLSARKTASVSPIHAVVDTSRR